jgi:hypothetical protein
MRTGKERKAAVMREKYRIMVICVGFICLIVLLSFKNTQAVPSFKGQTGLSCNVCHTVFPELTPFGRTFKLNGYTLSTSQKPYETKLPISAMIQASYTEQKGLSNRIDPYDDAPDAKFALPQQASLFYGGRIYDRLGALVQLSYDGIGNDLFLDNTDIRFADNFKLAGKDLTWGLTLNNNPTVQDVWNSTPAFGYPYASPSSGIVVNPSTTYAVATPLIRTLIDGSLGQQVGGLGAYAMWDSMIYGEIAAYRSNNKGITRPLGAGATTSILLDGYAPYWRLAVQYQTGPNSIAVGTYGMITNVFPNDQYGNPITAGPSDKYTDVAIDAQYQYITNKNIFTATTTWIHEKQDWDASFPLGITANSSDHLNTFKLSGSYYYRSAYGTFGGTVAYLRTYGDADQELYAPGPIYGSATHNPDTEASIFELNYTYQDQYKFALQYTAYDKFNGGSTNYDGSGRDASDNDTLYLLAWLMF